MSITQITQTVCYAVHHCSNFAEILSLFADALTRIEISNRLTTIMIVPAVWVLSRVWMELG